MEVRLPRSAVGGWWSTRRDFGRMRESVEERKRRLDESAGKLESAIDAIIG